MHGVENFSICYQRAPEFPYAPAVLNNHAGPSDNDKMSIVRARYYMFSNVPLRLSKFCSIISCTNRQVTI